MPDWLIVVFALIAIFVVIPFIWGRLKGINGGTEKAGDAVENAADRFSDIVGTIFVKGVGLVALVLGVGVLLLMIAGWFSFGFGPLVAALVLIAYGIYLLTPGERSVFLFF